MRRAALHMLHGQAAAGLHTAAFTGAKNRLSTVRIDMNTSHVEQIDHLDLDHACTVDSSLPL